MNDRQISLHYKDGDLFIMFFKTEGDNQLFAEDFRDAVDVSFEVADPLGRSMINPHPQIVLAEWKAETERVASKLASGQSKGIGWPERINILKEHSRFVTNRYIVGYSAKLVF